MEGAGAGAGAAYTACTAEEVLRGRRAGTIRALTDDVDMFFKLCVPGFVGRLVCGAVVLRVPYLPNALQGSIRQTLALIPTTPFPLPPWRRPDNEGEERSNTKGINGV